MEDLKGMTIGVQRGTVFVDTLQKTEFIDVKLYDHVKHLMDDVNSGLIQGGFADQPFIAYHLKQGEFPHARGQELYADDDRLHGEWHSQRRRCASYKDQCVPREAQAERHHRQDPR